MGNPVGKRLLGIIVCALILTAFSGLSFAQEAPGEEPSGIQEETMEVPIAVGLGVSEAAVSGPRAIREGRFDDVASKVTIIVRPGNAPRRAIWSLQALLRGGRRS